jgi:hypothetical protein
VGIARVGFKQVISQIGPSDEGFLSVEPDSDSPIRSRMDGSNWNCGLVSVAFKLIELRPTHRAVGRGKVKQAEKEESSYSPLSIWPIH